MLYDFTELIFFIVLSKFEQSFLYIETTPKVLSQLKKPTKNHNNPNQSSITKLNIFLYS